MREERGALHFEILHAIPGRLGIHMKKPSERDIQKCRFNMRRLEGWLVTNGQRAFSTFSVKTPETVIE